MPVVECDPDTAREQLETAGIAIEPGRTSHERWRAVHGDATAVAYDGKVVVQGRSPHDILGHLQEANGRASVYFDGACRGNPGPAAVGWVIATDDGIVDEGSRRIGHATNNQAEYHALIAALEAATAFGFHEVTVHGDAELVVKQLRGEYAVRNPTLRELRVNVGELLEAFESWEITHVPRELNERADRLANEALDA